MQDYDILIVGGGHGGAHAAVALRQNGFAGTIAVISDEPEIPYERPPLSKEYFSGDKDADRIRIRPAAFWADRAIDLLLGKRVIAVDPASQTATIADGDTIRYGKLIWAAGGRPRPLPFKGADAPNVLYIRTLADADRLKALADTADRIVVIGGGYIGLEAAAVLAKAGKTVILLEMLDRVLARAAGIEIARYVEDIHDRYGVEVRLGSSITALIGGSRVDQVQLDTGELIDCDLVIAGIGIIPEVGPLEAAGAAVANGVVVDAQCRTTLANIYAIGDCAAHINNFADGASIRLESVQNAVDMATVAAKDILDLGACYDAVPWFWSNQFDMKIQTVGLSAGHDSTVVRGDPDTGSFSVIYLRQGRVIALDCINCAKDYVQGKALVLARAEISPALLTDASTPLKQMILEAG